MLGMKGKEKDPKVVEGGQIGATGEKEKKRRVDYLR
jgi:hypothetical protein